MDVGLKIRMDYFVDNLPYLKEEEFIKEQEKLINYLNVKLVFLIRKNTDYNKFTYKVDYIISFIKEYLEEEFKLKDRNFTIIARLASIIHNFYNVAVNYKNNFENKEKFEEWSKKVIETSILLKRYDKYKNIQKEFNEDLDDLLRRKNDDESNVQVEALAFKINDRLELLTSENPQILLELERNKLINTIIYKIDCKIKEEKLNLINNHCKELLYLKGLIYYDNKRCDENNLLKFDNSINLNLSNKCINDIIKYLSNISKDELIQSKDKIKDYLVEKCNILNRISTILNNDLEKSNLFITKTSELITFFINRLNEEYAKEDCNYEFLSILGKLYSIVTSFMGSYYSRNNLFDKYADWNNRTIKILNISSRYNIYNNISKKFKGELEYLINNSDNIVEDRIKKIALLLDKKRIAVLLNDEKIKVLKTEKNSILEHIDKKFNVEESKLVNNVVYLINNEIKKEENKPLNKQNTNLLKNLFNLKGLIYLNNERYGEALASFEKKRAYRSAIDSKFYKNPYKLRDYLYKNCLNLNPRELHNIAINFNNYCEQNRNNNLDRMEILHKELNYRCNFLENIKLSNGIQNKKELCILYFFRVVLIMEQRNRLKLNEYVICVDKLTKYYDLIIIKEEKSIKTSKKDRNTEIKDELENIKIDYLSVANILRLKDYGNRKQKAKIRENYEYLVKTDNPEAQYECGMYMLKDNSNVALNHFTNSSNNGNENATIEEIKCLINDNNGRIEVYKDKNKSKKIVDWCYNMALKHMEDGNLQKIVQVFLLSSKFFEAIGKFEEALACINKIERTINRYNGEYILSTKIIWEKINLCKRMYKEDKYEHHLRQLAISKLDITNDDNSKKLNTNIGKACYELANVYYDKNTYYDTIEAIKFYKKSIKAGNIDALFKLGCLYYDGTEDYALLENKIESFRLFNLAANKGHNVAKLELARMYELGIGVEKDIAQAINLYREINNDKSLFRLAMVLKDSKEYENKLEAMEILEQLSKTNYKNAKFELAKILIDVGQKQNIKKVIKLLEEINSPEAIYELAMLLKNENKRKYLRLLKQASDKKNEKAMFELAKLYKEGTIIKKDEYKAFELLKKIKTLDSKFEQAVLIEKGFVYEQKQDIETSYKMFKDLKDLGHKGATLKYILITLKNNRNQITKEILDLYNSLGKSKDKLNILMTLTGNNFNDSIKILKSFIENNSNFSNKEQMEFIRNVYIDIANILFERNNLNDLEIARYYYEKATEIICIEEQINKKENVESINIMTIKNKIFNKMFMINHKLDILNQNKKDLNQKQIKITVDNIIKDVLLFIDGKKKQEKRMKQIIELIKLKICSNSNIFNRRRNQNLLITYNSEKKLTMENYVMERFKENTK